MNRNRFDGQARSNDSPRCWPRNILAVLAITLTAATSATAQMPLGDALNVHGDRGIWQPFVDLSGRAGGNVDGGEAALFLPLAQTDCELLFADIRGKLFDDESTEGNWGLAYRKMHDSGWILGAYGFCDLRETPSDNNFSQAVLGLEAMNYDWDLRVNGYLAEGGAKVTQGVAQGVLAGNQIVVVGGFERAYSGVDFEVGKLLWSSAGVQASACHACCDSGSLKAGLQRDIELRAFAGGFYFDDDAPGFPEVAGPRARVELRMYDLNLLGAGSRLVLGGILQHDDVRDTQAIAFLQVRIPFGCRTDCQSVPRGGHRHRLSPLERRMVDPIQRDVDIITNTNGLGGAEPALINGNPTGTVAQTTALNLAGDIGTANTLLVSGVGGTGNVATPVNVGAGQHVIGGGQTITVQGADSGAAAPFQVPGTRPTMNGTSTSNDVFTINNNATISGFDITGGEDGIFGVGVSGFLIANNNISGADDSGVDLAGTNDGTIVGNTASGNAINGFRIFTLSGGMLSGNTASGNSRIGFEIRTLSGGTVSGNTASGNADDGFFIDTLSGGTFSGNTASGNSNDGFRIVTLNGGTVSGNTASDNSRDGFFINILSGGTVSGNTASGNTDDGFDVNSFGGTSQLNNNVANNNGDAGYEITGGGGSASGNTGRNNGRNNSFP